MSTEQGGRVDGFDEWVKSMPDTHWAKHDISACRLGWNAALAQNAQAEQDDPITEYYEDRTRTRSQGAWTHPRNHAERVRVPEWTDAQCWEFMSMALRHVEYAEGSRGPTCEEIRQGVRHATASATPSQPEDADHKQEVSLSSPRAAEGQAVRVEAGAEAQPAEGGARAELTRVWVEPATLDSMRETDEFDGADGIECMVMKERDGQHSVPLYLHAGHPDAARLDWLERHPRLAEFVVDGQVTDCYLYAVSGAPGLKLREIIDAAMRAEPSKPAGAEVRRG